MKKMICLLIAVVLCLSVAAPVWAAENTFVPSITYKPNPEIVTEINDEGEEYIGVIRDETGEIIDYIDHGCLRITPVAHVWDEEIDVPKEIEDLLLFCYEGLKDGSMTIPYEKHEANLDPANMVIRDLFDIRWVCEEHRAMVEKEGNTLEVIFDMGIVADVQVYIMSYDEATEEWSPIVKAVNNGDGTVTCVFEHLCAFEFSMPVAGAAVVVEESQKPDITPWIILLGVAVVGVIVVLVAKNKKKAAV